MLDPCRLDRGINDGVLATALIASTWSALLVMALLVGGRHPALPSPLPFIRGLGRQATGARRSRLRGGPSAGGRGWLIAKSETGVGGKDSVGGWGACVVVSAGVFQRLTWAAADAAPPPAPLSPQVVLLYNVYPDQNLQGWADRCARVGSSGACATATAKPCLCHI
jgi:hypothetical protein